MNKSESKYFNTALKMDDAFVSLLQEKSMEYITVKEICQRAGVNRSTFYLHYETIGDLLSECVENTNKVFLSYFEQRNGNFVDKIDELPLDELILISREYLIPYLRYISENRAVFIAAIKNPYGMRSAIKFEGLQRHIFEPILDRFDYPANERKYAISYYINGIVAIIHEWLRGGCSETADKMAEIIINCVRPNAFIP